MKWIVTGLIAFLLLPMAAAAADRQWSLPDDPQAVVLQLRYGDPAGLRERLALQLHRDGAFAGGVGTPEQVRGRLADAELNELFAEIIESSAALELTSDRLRQQIQDEAARTGKPAQVRAADDLIVRLVLADRVHEFRCPAPEVMRSRYPNLCDLHQACAIRRRLENVIAVARAGGTPAAERMAALATDELQRQNKSDLRVTARDLQVVRGRPGDLRQMEFVVPADGPSNPASRETHVSVMESPGRPPRISITSLAAPK